MHCRLQCAVNICSLPVREICLHATYSADVCSPTKMSSIADLKNEAEEIGLKGDFVQQYILERQKEQRE